MSLKSASLIFLDRAGTDVSVTIDEKGVTIWARGEITFAASDLRHLAGLASDFDEDEKEAP